MNAIQSALGITVIVAVVVASPGSAFSQSPQGVVGTNSRFFLDLDAATGNATPVSGLGLRGFEFVKGLAFDPGTGTLYGSGSGYQLITINTTTGEGAAVGAVGFHVHDLAFDPATGTLYGTDPFGADQLITINTTTGAGTVVGAIGFNWVVGLAFDSATGTLYGTDGATDQLITINMTTGEGAAVGALGFSDVYGLAFDPDTGTLYGTDTSTDQLITINTTTGEGAAVGALGFSDVKGLAFDPDTGTLYGADDAPSRLITINTTTGAGTAVGALGFSGVTALAFDADTGTLYGTDLLTAQLIRINTSTGAGTAVGALGFGAVWGLAFDPATGTLYGTDDSTDQLITINTTTGAGTLVGGLGFGAVWGLAFDPDTGTLYGAATSDKLITINTTTGAGTLVGVLGFSNVHGLAFDPDTGTLYGTDIDSDQLITINTTTGAGTAVGVLGFDDVYGLAFDPDSATLYGTTGVQLITINTTTGVGTAVGALGFDRVEGLAFDPDTGRLYGTDLWTDQLITINTTTGTGTAVGALGFGNVRSLAFDPDTGTLYGTDESTDQLITINPTTGAGTAVGALGFSNVHGLAFDPNTGTLCGTDIDSDQLITINTSTGMGTAVGPLGFTFVAGLAFDPNTGTLCGTDTTTDQLITINTTTGAGMAVGPTRHLNIWGLAFLPIGRLYVDRAAAGANDGSSWADAYTSLQDALADAAGSGGVISEIWVAVGTYTPDNRSCAIAADCDGPGGGTCPAGQCIWNSPREQTFQLLNGVAIYGGFAGGETSLDQRNIEANETILSGDLLGDDAPVACTQDSPDCDLYGGRCLDSGFCIVSQNNGENSYHVVTGSGTDGTAILDGFTVTAGNADGTNPHNYGGAMLNYTNSSPTVANCTFVGNSGEYGGAMRNVTGSSPTLINCVFTGNSASFAGGGMENWNNSNPTLTECAFLDNSSDIDGGGIRNNESSPTLINCTFTGNSSVAVGGGVSNLSNSSPTLTNCAFIGNSAGTSGGGIGNSGSSNANVTNCTFIGNTAASSGGGMYNNASSPTVTNCTFSGNSANNDGGGMYNWDSGSNPALTNCVLWGNSDLGGTDESAQIDGGTPVVNYSIVQGGWSGAGGTGNGSSDPLFVRNPYDGGDGWGDDPGTPGVDEGANDDFGDLHLQSDSPAIDAADTTALPADTADLDNDGDTAERIPLDLDGGPRVLDDLLTPDTGVAGSGVVDMGAYEFLRDCDGNGIPDDQDLANCTGDPDCSDCNTNNIPDFCDIADCDPAIDPSCDDCNLDGIPDGCVPPANCIEAIDDGAWTNGNTWDLDGDHPNVDDGTGTNVPDQNVTIDARAVTLDINVEIPTLRILNGASLKTNGHNLTVVDPGGTLITGGTSGLRVDNNLELASNDAYSTPTLTIGDGYEYGSVMVGSNSTVNVCDCDVITGDCEPITNFCDPLTNTMTINGGGLYAASGPNSQAQLNAGNIALNGSHSPDVPGGTMTLTGSMNVTTTGDFVMDGTGAVPCDPGGLRVPSGTRPILPISDTSVLYVAADFILLGSIEISVGPNAAVYVGGNFVNQSTSPNCIDLGGGNLILDGGSPGLRNPGEQKFEVAGKDYSPDLEGFAPAGASHTNFSIGTIEVAAGSEVRFVDEYDNDGNGQGLREALYVHKLILRSGSVITVDNSKVYYGDLIDEGATINVLPTGDSAQVPDHVARPQTAPYPHDRKKNRYISFDPDKEVSDGLNLAFKVELLSIDMGSCDDDTGAQGGNVDFCRTDRGAADCKACSASGDSCISAAIDCPPGESCDPTGATCVNDLPNSGGSNVAMMWWVGPEKDTASEPSANIHLLVSQPFRKVSTDWPNPVHAGDCEVVPQARYGVRAVETAGGAESDELVVLTTALNVCSASGELCNVAGDCATGETCDPVGSPAPFWWGDVVGVLAFHCNGDIREQTCDPNTANGDCTGFGVPAACCTGVSSGICDCPGGDPCVRAWELPNGVTNVDDVTAALWTSAPAPPTTVSADFTWVDVHGNDSFTPGSQNFDPPNNKINASDLQQIGSAFGGLPYKFYDPKDCPNAPDWPTAVR